MVGRVVQATLSFFIGKNPDADRINKIENYIVLDYRAKIQLEIEFKVFFNKDFF